MDGKMELIVYVDYIDENYQRVCMMVNGNEDEIMSDQIFVCNNPDDLQVCMSYFYDAYTRAQAQHDWDSMDWGFRGELLKLGNKMKRRSF